MHALRMTTLEAAALSAIGAKAGREIPTLDKLRNGPPTISVTESAPYLGVSRAYAYKMARQGRLPVIKLGPRRVRVSTAGLLRMLEGTDHGAA